MDRHAFEQPPGSQTALLLMRSATLAHNIQVPALQHLKGSCQCLNQTCCAALLRCIDDIGLSMCKQCCTIGQINDDDENIKVKSQLVQKLEWKRTDTTDRITFPAKYAIGNVKCAQDTNNRMHQNDATNWWRRW